MYKAAFKFTTPAKFLVGWSVEEVDMLGIPLGWYFYLHLGLFHVGVHKYIKPKESKSALEVIKGGKSGEN